MFSRLKRVRQWPRGGGRSYGGAGMNLSINTSPAKAQPRLQLQPRAATLPKNQLRLTQLWLKAAAPLALLLLCEVRATSLFTHTTA